MGHSNSLTKPSEFPRFQLPFHRNCLINSHRHASDARSGFASPVAFLFFFLFPSSATPRSLYIFYLQRVPPLRVDDLIEDLKDGTRLLALLEVLSGEKLVSGWVVQKLVQNAIDYRLFSLWREAESSVDHISSATPTPPYNSYPANV